MPRWRTSSGHDVQVHGGGVDWRGYLPFTHDFGDDKVTRAMA